MPNPDTRQILYYEQCPWDRDHVLSLYRTIPDPVADGAWHPISCPKPFAFYRVWEGETFQAIYGNDAESPLGREVMAQTPPRSDEDTGWVLMRDPYSYSLSSVFAVEPGTMEALTEVEKWLKPYALRFMSDPAGGVRGWADFWPLEPGPLGDAMERLLLLEAVCLEIKREGADSARRVWRHYEDALIGGADDQDDPEEIVPLPSGLPRSGPKRREAVAAP